MASSLLPFQIELLGNHVASNVWEPRRVNCRARGSQRSCPGLENFEHVTYAVNGNIVNHHLVNEASSALSVDVARKGTVPSAINPTPSHRGSSLALRAHVLKHLLAWNPIRNL